MNWWWLTRKDLRLQMRDRRSLAVLLLLPVIFISIVGLSTGKMLGWRTANQVVQVGWVDHSDSDLAKRLQAKLQERNELRVVTYHDERSATSDVFSGRCTLALIVGSDFQARINELPMRDFFARKQGHGRLVGGLAALDIRVETKSSWKWISQLIGDTLLSLTLEEVFPEVAQKHNLGRALIRNMEVAAAEESSETLPTDSVAIKDSVAEGRSAGAAIYDHIVPGFTVMFTFFLVNVMARSFLAERELGTLKRLRLAPITPVGLLIGKTLPYLLVSLLQSLALFVFGRLMFGMSWGEQPWLLLPIVFCTSLAATSLGLLVATSVRSDSQVSSYSNLIVITLAGIGGCFVPRDWMPDTMKDISLITPHAWSLTAYLEAMTNPQPNLTVIAQGCALLLGFSIVFFGVGRFRFRTLS